jgi:hypothetical protein
VSGRAGRALAAAYPPPVRRRWGADLAAEIDASGVAGWIDSLAGAARLWLRPAQWPASTGSHLRRAVVVVALVTAAVTTVGVRSALPAPATANHGLTALGLVVLVVGLVALTPLPRLTSASLAAIVRALATPLLVAALMSAAVYVLADMTGRQTGLRGVAEIAFYWLTLVVAVSSPAIALCRLDPRHLHVPDDTRATVGLAIVVAGHSIGGVAGLAFAATPGIGALAGVQLVLAGLTLLALTDLRRRRLA